MPRTQRRARPSTPKPSNALTAAAVNLQELHPRRRAKQVAPESWQETAWSMYDAVGELRAGANWLGNAMSRVTLKVVKGTGDDQEVIEDGFPAEVLAAFFGGDDGQSQALRTFAVHATVPGESFIVYDPDSTPPGGEDWLMASKSELTMNGETWKLDDGSGYPRMLTADALVIRIWRKHPKKSAMPDSPVRPLLGVLNELLQLTKRVAATTDSRLAGSGILFLPNEMTFTKPQSMQVEGQPSTSSDLATFQEVLGESMLTPMADQADPSAVVPTTVMAPGDQIGNVKHLTFYDGFDEKLIDLRTEAIRRVGLGLDMPVEVLLGQGDVNHWGAWAIDEAAIKIHLEPMGELFCNAVSEQILRAALRKVNYPEWEDYRIVADTSALRLRPNRPAEAMELRKNLDLKASTTRRETGFDESDAPDKAERDQMILEHWVLNGTPEMQIAAAKKLGLDIDIELPAIEPAAPAPRDEVVELPPGQDPRNLPQLDMAASLMAALRPHLELFLATRPPAPVNPVEFAAEMDRTALVKSTNVAAHLLVNQAMQVAHTRINKRRNLPIRPVAADTAEAALGGMFDKAGEAALALGHDPAEFTRFLHGYCRDLLIRGTVHEAPFLYRQVEHFVSQGGRW